MNREEILYRNQKYDNYDILAFSSNWLIVFDGRHNYMLFNCMQKAVLMRCKNGQMPTHAEFYSTFDNAMDNLTKKLMNAKT